MPHRAGLILGQIPHFTELNARLPGGGMGGFGIDWYIRASSYEPGQLGWLSFRDLASRLFSVLKHRCVHMRGRAGPVTEISVFATEISVTGIKIFRYEHSSPVTGTKHFRQNTLRFHQIAAKMI